MTYNLLEDNIQIVKWEEGIHISKWEDGIQSVR